MLSQEKVRQCIEIQYTCLPEELRTMSKFSLDFSLRGLGGVSSVAVPLIQDVLASLQASSLTDF